MYAYLTDVLSGYSTAPVYRDTMTSNTYYIISYYYGGFLQLAEQASLDFLVCVVFKLSLLLFFLYKYLKLLFENMLNICVFQNSIKNCKEEDK